jgi:hypothetical protein
MKLVLVPHTYTCLLVLPSTQIHTRMRQQKQMVQQRQHQQTNRFQALVPFSALASRRARVWLASVEILDEEANGQEKEGRKDVTPPVRHGEISRTLLACSSSSRGNLCFSVMHSHAAPVQVLMVSTHYRARAFAARSRKRAKSAGVYGVTLNCLPGGPSREH